MRRNLAIIIFILIVFKSYSQTNNAIDKYIADDRYNALTKIADSLFLKKEYAKCVSYYHSAFKLWGDKGWASNRYNAAIAYCAIHETDSAFHQLIRLAEKTDYLDCDSLENPAFQMLKTDSKWNRLKELLCTCNCSNPGLAALMQKIRKNDQGCRGGIIDSIRKKFGYRSTQMKKQWAIMDICDSLDLIKIDSVYSIYGWPDTSLAGKDASTTFWLVIQHSPLQVQKKYFPIMQQAVKEGKASSMNLAYLEDRILMKEGKPQKYGTQFQVKADGVMRLYKLQDKKNVNLMRDSVGLMPLSADEIMSISKDTLSH